MKETPKKPFSVPPLELFKDSALAGKKASKSDKEARNQYNTLKFGAGYKPRCSDLERWHLYKVNEAKFVQSGLNYSCTFNFVDIDSLNNNNNNSNNNSSNHDNNQLQLNIIHSTDINNKADITKQVNEEESNIKSSPPPVEDHNEQYNHKENNVTEINFKKINSNDGESFLESGDIQQKVDKATQNSNSDAQNSLEIHSPNSQSHIEEAANSFRESTKINNTTTSLDDTSTKSRRVRIKEDQLLNSLLSFNPHSATPHLDLLNDKMLIINNKLHYKTLEEFNVKKFNQVHYIEWENDMRKRLQKMLKQREASHLKSPAQKRNRDPKHYHSSTLSSVALEKYTVSYDIERQYDNLKITINPLLLLKEKEEKKLQEEKIKNYKDPLTIIDNLLTEEEKELKKKIRMAIPIPQKQDQQDDETDQNHNNNNTNNHHHSHNNSNHHHHHHDKSNHKEEKVGDLSLNLHALSPKKKFPDPTSSPNSPTVKKRTFLSFKSIRVKTPRKKGRDSDSDENGMMNLHMISSPRELSECIASPRDNNVTSDDDELDFVQVENNNDVKKLAAQPKNETNDRSLTFRTF